MSRPVAAVTLALRFAAAVVRSGLQTTRMILRPDPAMRPGFIEYDFAPMSERGAALLGSLITLTPGTTTVDIDMVSHRMWIHLLDTRGEDAAREEIRSEFEAPIRVLFGTEGPA
jgi:multisubunit Na+/H+ antiporter MnhE subunit